jgi:PAS domain S-box-containing protein
MAGLERFQALIENSTDAISLVDAEAQVLYASASAAKVLGYHPEELLGRNGLELLHPHDRDHCLRMLRRVLTDPQCSDRVQVRVLQKDGNWRWVESRASNLLEEPQVGAIVITYRQIDARRAEEEERQRLAEALTRSNAELQAFAYTVAHDLREPLRTISAFTELLVRRAQLSEADKEIASFVVEGVKRMSTLLDSLLSSATSGSKDSLRPVKLEYAAAQAMQNLRETITSSGAIITVEPLPTVHGHECDLVRLFQHLISNALKYRSDAAIEVRITADRLGPDWVVKVRDNGIGISKEHHRRVFGLFTRLHSEEIPGTGIGLAVCKQIIEGLGQAIWVESEPGAGSTFCFTLAAGQEKSRMPAIAVNGNGSRAI